MKTIQLFFISLCGLLLLSGLTPVRAEEVIATLDPTEVHISAFYNGTTVAVAGVIPADTEAVIRIIGQRENVHAKEKGKVGGVLWMNIKDITYENVPGTFILLTSEKLKDMVDSPDSTIGFAAVKNEVTILPESEDKDFLYGEFVKLKKKQHLFLEDTSGITYGTDPEGNRTITAHLPIPPMMKPGSYDIEVMAVRDGKVVGQENLKLRVREIGLPKKLSELAFQHSLLYGIMAVVIAVLAGLLMGVIFKGKGGGAH